MNWYGNPKKRCDSGEGCKCRNKKLDDQDDVLPGGTGDIKSVHDVDDTQLGMGIKVEMEHTDDMGKAVEIALDHLAEDSEYYTKLKSIHKD